MDIKTLIRFWPNKFQYRVLKYITSGRVTIIDIKIILFSYNCSGKRIFKIATILVVIF